MPKIHQIPMKFDDSGSKSGVFGVKESFGSGPGAQKDQKKPNIAIIIPLGDQIGPGTTPKRFFDPENPGFRLGVIKFHMNLMDVWHFQFSVRNIFVGHPDILNDVYKNCRPEPCLAFCTVNPVRVSRKIDRQLELTHLRCSSSKPQRETPSRWSLRASPSPSSSCRRPPSRQPW